MFLIAEIEEFYHKMQNSQIFNGTINYVLNKEIISF